MNTFVYVVIGNIAKRFKTEERIKLIPATYYLCQDCHSCHPSEFYCSRECCGSDMIEIQNYIYKKGDKVQIISNDEFAEEIPYTGICLDDIDPGVDSEMEDYYASKEATVTGITSDGYVQLDVDKGEFYWSPLWLKGNPLAASEVELKEFLKGDLFEL